MIKTSNTRIGNIISSKCPTCHSGYLFKDKNPYHLKMIFKMNDKCSNCNQSFAPEPRFYDGAMYVSYAFSVAIVASIFIGFNVLIENPTMTPMLISTFTLTIGLSPLSFRLSRSIWIHIFFRFDKSKAIHNK